MKSLASLILLLSTCMGARAQTWTTTLTGGLTLPVGTFASENVIGFDLNLGVNYEFFHHLGITVAGDYKDFPSFNGFHLESALAGPSYRLPLGRWDLKLSMLGGISTHPDDETPGISGEPFVPESHYTRMQFAYRGGLGFDYHLSKRVFLQADGDFMATHIPKQIDILLPAGGNFTTTAVEWVNTPLNMLDVRLGVGLTFGR